MNRILVAVAALSLGLGASGAADARGCLKGAAVGAVGGHFAGHHPILGAAAGCAIGHHMAHRRMARDHAAERHAHVDYRR